MRLKEIRERSGYSRKQVCEWLGCSIAAYTRYEQGTRNPSISTLIKLADVFGVSLDHLVGRGSCSDDSLSDWENEFLEILRTADPRAQMDAFNLMSSHKL